MKNVIINVLKNLQEDIIKKDTGKDELYLGLVHFLRSKSQSFPKWHLSELWLLEILMIIIK